MNPKMRFTPSTLLGFLFPLLAIVVLVILLTVTLYRLLNVQNSMRDNASANISWVLSQTRMETLLLANALQQSLITANSEAALQHRYQMLQSRINVLNDGPQARALEAMGLSEPLLQQAHDTIQLYAILKHDPLNALTKNHEPIYDALYSLNDTLQYASSKAMAAEWEDAGAQLDRYRNTVLALFFLMIGILACSAVISTQLLLSLKKARDNEHIRIQGIELQKQLENERKISGLYRSFGAMLSHQFRTPLAVIDATMQRLMRAGDYMTKDEIKYRAGKVRDATLRLSQLIESILQADRYMEQLQVSLQGCNLVSLAQKTVSEYRVGTSRKSIDFIDATDGESSVECDPMLTVQILDNLLSNALKYSNEDGVVTVRVSNQEGWVTCEVCDTGLGISPTDLPHIFDRYFRAHNAASIIGTGIGLHIAMELATLQGGMIEVSSELNKGSRFTLLLPAVSL